jgi:hypothetical protein
MISLKTTGTVLSPPLTRLHIDCKMPRFWYRKTFEGLSFEWLMEATIFFKKIKIQRRSSEVAEIKTTQANDAVVMPKQPKSQTTTLQIHVIRIALVFVNINQNNQFLFGV